MLSRPFRRTRPSLTLLIASVVLVGVASGCVTGKRPTLGGTLDPARAISKQPLGIEAADAILLPLESTAGKTYTARYLVTPTSGKTPVEAIVAQQAGIRTVTIGDVRFYRGGGGDASTCNLTKSTCEPGILDQRVSDIPGASSNFDRDAPAARIRVSASAMRTTLFASNEAFELSTTKCVNFPNGKASDSYCVVPTGQLARSERADATILLQQLLDTVDPALLTKPA